MYLIKDRTDKIETEALTIKVMRRRAKKELLSVETRPQHTDVRNLRENKTSEVKLAKATFQPSPEDFFQACQYGDKEVVRQLLANHGHQLDIQQVEPVTGYTAFHLACAGGHLSVVQQLMKAFGTETCRQLLTKNDGKSGLILAAGAGRIEIVQTILSTYKKNEIR